MNRIALFDISIVNATLQESVCLILKTLAGDRPATVFFVNAHCINVSRSDLEYRAILQNADAVFADGVGMKIASLVLGSPLRDNVNGTDLYPPLLDALEGTGYRIFLLGGDPGVADEMRRRALEARPNLIFCGVHHGFISPEERPSVLEKIRDSKPDLLLVAMGVPRQEKWIAEHFSATGAKIAIGVGGLFNFYSGTIPRAPRWMRKTGLEWFHRFLMEPGRMWKRYLLGNFLFLVLTVRERLLKRKNSG